MLRREVYPEPAEGLLSMPVGDKQTISGAEMPESEEHITQWIIHGREERNLEYKSSLDWADAATKAKIVKSAIAMANLRDGGWIVIGVDRIVDDRGGGMIREEWMRATYNRLTKMR